MMSEHVYKLIELTGSSPVSSDEAVKNALAKAARTVRDMRWFEVTDVRGHIANNAIGHWQVTVKVGFTLEE
jgi:flavin-binding protein dodecin